MALKLPRAARLTRRDEFRKVRLEGRSQSGPFFVLGYWHSPIHEPARVGIITTKKTGGAVERNRARRRLREIVRIARPKIVCGTWIVLIARKGILSASPEALSSEWLRLAKKASILTPSE